MVTTNGIKRGADCSRRFIWSCTPVLPGTFLITLIAMALAGPVGLFFLTSYIFIRICFLRILEKLLNQLWGYWQVYLQLCAVVCCPCSVTVGPFIRRTGRSFGISSLLRKCTGSWPCNGHNDNSLHLFIIR